MAAEIRALLVEETERRAELRKVMASAQLNVVDEAGLGPEAITAIHQSRPDVVVLSMEEPVVRPLKTIESLVLNQPQLPIIVVSTLSDRDSLRKAMQAGARDFLLKPVRPQDLHKSVVELAEAEVRRRQAVEVEGGARVSQGEVIAVFGVKGGIGKTSISVNLAAAIAAQTKQKVGLLDMDMQLGDVAVLLNVLPQNTIADAAASVEKLDSGLLQSLMQADPSGVSILPAPLQPEQADEISPEHVQKIVQVMAQTFDYVVVDMPPMVSEHVGIILEKATLVLLLTTQEVLALRRTKVLLQMMRQWGYSQDKVKLVVNHAYNVNGVQANDIEAALDYPIFYDIPNDQMVSTAVKLGRPFVVAAPGAPVSRSVVELSRKVTGLNRPQQSGLFKKLKFFGR